ncbi:MAG: glycosyltransferase family 9 protein [Sedimentisphaerales bacterium]
MAGQPKNILIIKPSALGDIVLALPALSALRHSFPQAKISWLVRPEFADLLQGHPDLDELILFDRRLLGKWWYQWKANVELKRLFNRLYNERFDLVFDFQGLFRTGFFGWITGSKRRFGMAGAREFAHLFYTDKIPQDSSCIHLVDYYLKMVASAGAQHCGIEFKLPQDTKADEAVRKLLLSKKVNIENYVVLVPGAAQPEKRWPIERFAELAKKISLRFGSSIVAIGSQGERDYIGKIGGEIINMAGRTTIRELISLVKGASLVISNDTGPGHIAAALGVPVVMIFGPTNPARVCSYKRPDCVVAIEPNERGMKADSYDPKHSISHITVEQVFEAACRQITKNGSPSTPLRAG